MWQKLRQLARDGLMRLGFERIQPKLGPWAAYSHDALALAQYSDADFGMLERPQQHPERVRADVSKRVCNWYLPVFDTPFYAGLMTIFRLADFLQRRHGITNRFLICGGCDVSVIRRRIGEAFPRLGASSVIALDSPGALQNIPSSDYSVATLWTTAYVLLGVTNTGIKLYMIQDFEPLFYPAGSTYAQAELTYRFGFYGIANTQSLKDIYERDYGSNAVVLVPCVDTNIFRPAPARQASVPKRLFYYARPGTPRNGFELAAQAFKLLKPKFGNGLEILCAGAAWDPKDFGLEGVVRTVGMLPYEETGDLYRSCDVGLALMMTKHPSYLPFELMACGVLVVANDNPANRWLLRHDENCLLSPPTASCLAAVLARALSDHPELERIRANGVKQIHRDHADWDASLDSVSQFILNLHVTSRSVVHA